MAVKSASNNIELNKMLLLLEMRFEEPLYWDLTLLGIVFQDILREHGLSLEHILKASNIISGLLFTSIL